MKRSNTASSSSDCSTSSSPKSKKAKTTENKIKELIKVSIYTKPENDGKNEDDITNWKLCDFRVLNEAESDDDDDDQEGTTSPMDETQLVVMASHIKDFDTHKYSTNDDDEDEDTTTTPTSSTTTIANRVRIGILVENGTNFDLKPQLTIDELEIRTPVVRNKDEAFISYHTCGTSRNPLLLKRHELAFDEQDINRERINKLGLMKLKVWRAELRPSTHPKLNTVVPSTGGDVKIKSSMVKDSAMSLCIGTSVTNPNTKWVTPILIEQLLEYHIKYRNYTGFLLEIVRAGLTVEQAKSQMVETASSSENSKDVIDISDNEEDLPPSSNHPPPLLPPLPPSSSLPSIPPRSLSITDKITEKATEIEGKNTVELLKYLKLKDEDLYKGIEKKFKEEGIDGVSFLLLTIETLGPMKLRIGDQVKLKQIIQQIKENSGY